VQTRPEAAFPLFNVPLWRSTGVAMGKHAVSPCPDDGCVRLDPAYCELMRGRYE